MIMRRVRPAKGKIPRQAYLEPNRFRIVRQKRKLMDRRCSPNEAIGLHQPTLWPNILTLYIVFLGMRGSMLD